MQSLIRRCGFLYVLVTSGVGLLLALSSCNVTDKDGKAYLSIGKDSTWDAYDSLEITWLDTASGKGGVLFQGQPKKLQVKNKWLADPYQGQSIAIVYKGFVGDSLVSEVRQHFDPVTPTLFKRDTLITPQTGKPNTSNRKGQPPKVTPLDTFTVSINDSVLFTTRASLDSGALGSFVFDFNGDGISDDSSSLSGQSSEIQGGHRFPLPAIYTTRLKVRNAFGTLTEGLPAYSYSKTSRPQMRGQG